VGERFPRSAEFSRPVRLRDFVNSPVEATGTPVPAAAAEHGAGAGLPSGAPAGQLGVDV